MKTRIIHYLAAIGLLFLTSGRALAQKPLRDLFPEKQVVATVPIDVPRVSWRTFNSSKRYVSVSWLITSRPLDGRMLLYDISGELIWEKQLFAYRVILPDEGDRVVVLYNIDRYHAKGHNACFDRSGNKLWEIPITVPGIMAVSSDGKYGITTFPGSEEKIGFHIFNLETGQELETPITRGYSAFRAQFLNEKRIIVTTMMVDVALDQEALERSRQTRGEGKRKRGDPAPRTHKFTRHPPLFIVYDIPSRTILTQRELFTPDGESLHLVAHRAGPHISIAPDGQRVAMVLYKTIESPPYVKDIPTLVQVDLQGNVEWENDDFTSGYLQGIYEVGIGTILIHDPPRTFHLVDRSNGKTLWWYESDQRESSVVRNLFIQDNWLILHTSDSAVKGTRVHTLDLATGTLIQNTEYSNKEILLFRNQAGAVIYSKSQKQLQFIR